MIKQRSYLELNALPFESLGTGIKLPAILNETKYGPVSEDDKRDLIVIKEAFIFTDPSSRRVGVFRA